MSNGHVTILRPVNVVDENKKGAIGLAVCKSFMNYLRIFLKGGENAHIIHAETVADAAMYFIKSDKFNVNTFFVSLDHEKENTFAGVWLLAKLKLFTKKTTLIYLPWYVPYKIREIRQGYSKHPLVTYSSEKLKKSGFDKFMSLKETIDLVLKDY